MRYRAMVAALLAAGAAGCGNGTGPRYNVSGVWMLTISGIFNGATADYQFMQSGSTVAGFTYGGVPRVGVCGSLQGSALQLVLNGGETFVGNFVDAASVSGTVVLEGHSSPATLTRTTDPLETGGGYPSC